ncbi:MAG: response regulator, partial [Gemmatimonadetes bacterium]|nr:response regulator [Gemmatimonadota bacterium]
MSEGRPLTGHQVLVANDDPAQLRAMAAVLEAAGAEVAVHPDGRSVVQALIDGAAPSVIVTDLHMPELDGWQLARLVRSTDFPGFGVVPLLVTSATFAGVDVEAVSLSAGANAFLAVPAPPERVVRYVHQLAIGQRPRPERSAVIFSEDAQVVDELVGALEKHGARASLGRPEGPYHQCWISDWVILDEDQPDGLEIAMKALCVEERRPALVVLSRDSSPRTRLALIVRGADAVLPRSTPAALLADLLPQIGRQRSLLRVEQTLKSRAADLDRAHDRWRDLFDAIPDMVLVLDRQGAIEASNAAARAAFGGVELLDGRPAGDFLSESLLSPLTSEVGVGSALGTLTGSGGRHLRVEATYRSFGEEAGTRIAVLRDITDRMEAEERQRSIEAQLFRGQKLESLGVMASGIAHDFNNLLLSILGNTALAADDLPEDHPGRHFVEQAGLAAERAAELTGQILAYSGEAQRRVQPVDVGRAVRELGSLLEPAMSKKAELRIVHETEDAWIEADPGQLRQVLM